MEMMKVYGKMPSEVRLETNWGMSVDEIQLTIKYLILEKFGKFPALTKLSLCGT